MGNVGGREDGEGTSGVNEQCNSDPMIHSPPHSPNEAYQLPCLFPPQIPMFPWLRSAEMIQAQNDVLVQNTTCFENFHNENNLPWYYIDSSRGLGSQIPQTLLQRPGQFIQVENDPPLQNTAYHEDLDYGRKKAVMITWCFGGKEVAVTGSWDNWKTIEHLHSLGKDFVIMKMLPLGVHRYNFIVDQVKRYAPNLPWEFGEFGNPYNILDLQEHVPEALENLSEFESPPSPISSYDNQPLNDGDLSKPPPELPPQLQRTLLDERSLSIRSCGSLSRPSHAYLNHLYKLHSDDGQSIALCSTQRFLQKYVTIVLYKSLNRKN